MCHYPLFETLAVNNGKFQQLTYHQARVNSSFTHFFKCDTTLNLAEIPIPMEYSQGFYRCRIDYNTEGYQIGFYTYTPKKITRFACVNTENLDYQFKYSDRKRLEKLKNLQSDEVIIINNGFVSDCTIGNLLFLKNGRWYSPMHYLLKGTQLAALLDQKQVELVAISAENLFDYEKIMLINALNPFDERRAIPIASGIIWQ